MSWKNNDGLTLKFGTENAKLSRIGEYHFDGNVHMAEIALQLIDLTQTETILDYNFILPVGALIQEVEVISTTAAATGTAVDLGLIKASDKTTEYDFNGILAAYPTASMDTGDLNRLSEGVGTYCGAVLGVPLTEACYISASMTDATAFTAGKVLIRLSYLQLVTFP